MSAPCTFLLVPGAFHTRGHMRTLTEALEKHGHHVETMPLASMGNAKATVSDDVNAIREATTRLIDASDRDVVVVLHSFAGRPGGAALSGLRMSERTGDGRASKGGLRGVIHLAAMVMSEEAATARVAKGKQWSDWQREDEETGLLYAAGDSKAMFYHDVPEPLVTELVETLEPHSVQALMGLLPDGPRVATAPEFDGRRAYVYCTEDAVFPIAVQHALIEATGTTWHTRDMATSHSPFASRPDELTLVVEQLSQEFVSTYRK